MTKATLRRHWKSSAALLAAVMVAAAVTINACSHAQSSQQSIRPSPTSSAAQYTPPGYGTPYPSITGSYSYPTYSYPTYSYPSFSDGYYDGYYAGPPQSAYAYNYGGVGSYEFCSYTRCVTPTFSCRLPIFGGGPGSGGFINVTNGDYTPDPASNVSVAGGSSYGGSYDRAFAKWLPVSVAWVSPDGKHYTYPDTSSVIHVVDIATGADRVLTHSGAWLPLGYLAAGIYALSLGSGGGPVGGLWYIDPAVGSPRQVIGTGYWRMVGSGVAYGDVSAGYPSGASNQILRLDLRTGVSTGWFQRPEYFSTVVGIAADGAALLQASPAGSNGGPAEFWRAASASAAEKLVLGLSVDQALIDDHGIWIWGSGGAGQGTFLLANLTDASGTRQSVLERISTVSGAPAGSCG